VFAIINDNDRQYMVRKGDVILLDRKNLAAGEEIRFDRVLFVDDKVGTPYVDGASVSGCIRGEIKGRKVYVEKFKRRKKYRRRCGHRQKYTQVEITEIVG